MDNQTAKKVPESEAKAIFQTMLMSDLHLEFDNVIPPEFSVVAPVLILAGDIGKPDVPSLQTVETKDGKSTRKRRITVDDTNEWHAQQLAWLREEIEKARNNGEHVVIITHHAPCRHDTCSTEDEESDLMDAFVNDHDTDCVDPVRLWVYGHTHWSTDLIMNSTRIVSNQCGYAHENCGFRPNMKITLYDDRPIDVIDSVHCDS
ncbi:unnamed protein product [Rotaria socialis]|uniref:Calcineurin-like phosphoesterase domain-containing protein n=1 Tax=Rotaria socialis TaxID=392032 RepID=A0A821JVF2_9BILA|nr:unnamed protein product [Rotaria socialis]CAF4725379.1 unnamed protein product [Rotaria socialis]